MVRYPHLLGPKVGMVSAVTLRVNREVPLHSDHKECAEATS